MKTQVRIPERGHGLYHALRFVSRKIVTGGCSKFSKGRRGAHSLLFLFFFNQLSRRASGAPPLVQMIPAPCQKPADIDGRLFPLVSPHAPIALSTQLPVPLHGWFICSPFRPFQRRYRVNRPHRFQRSDNSNRIRYATLAFSPCRRGEALQYRSSILSNSLPCHSNRIPFLSLSPRSHRFPALTRTPSTTLSHLIPETFCAAFWTV